MNPQLESLKLDKSKTDSIRVFNLEEQLRLLSALQDHVDEFLKESEKQDFTNKISELTELAKENRLDDNDIISTSDKLKEISSSSTQLKKIDQYLNKRRELDTATSIRQSQIDQLIKLGEIDLANRLTSGDLSELTEDQNALIDSLTNTETVLKDAISNFSKLLDSQIGSNTSNIVNNTYNTTSSNMYEQLTNYIKENKIGSEEQLDYLKYIYETLRNSETKNVYEKIRSKNTEELIAEGLEQLHDDLKDIDLNQSILDDYNQMSDMQEVGEKLGDDIIDGVLDWFGLGEKDSGKESGKPKKGGFLSRIGNAAKNFFSSPFTKLAAVGGTGAAAMLYSGKVGEGSDKIPKDAKYYDFTKTQDTRAPSSRILDIQQFPDKRKPTNIDFSRDNKLGFISQQYESGRSGAGTISSGKGDFGGKSYGTYQLASKTGTLDKFLDQSGYREQFGNVAVGSAAFDTKWKELAKDPKFAEAQHEFIKQTHYDPQMQKLSKSGIDLSARSDAVKNAVFSTSVQYGANSSVIEKALQGKDISAMSDSDIIKQIQGYKAANVDTHFKSSSPEVRASIISRAVNEGRDLLSYQAYLTNKDSAGLTVPSQDGISNIKNDSTSVASASTIKPESKLSQNTSTPIQSPKSSILASSPQASNNTSNQSSILAPSTTTIINSNSDGFLSDARSYNR